MLQLLFAVAALVGLGTAIYIILRAFPALLAYQQAQSHTKRGKRRTVSVEVSIMGLQIRGGRIIGALGLGIGLILIVLNFSTKALIAERPKPLPLAITPPVDLASVTRTKFDDEPTYRGFRFLKDVRVVDLRSRVPVPPDKQSEEYSPVVWTRYALVEKTADAPDSLTFEFATSGVGLRPRVLTHHHRVLRSIAPHVHGDKTMREAWRVQADVSTEPIGVPFLVVTEATYWNGFAGEDAEWASIASGENTEEIAIILMFPENKPFGEYELRAYPHGEPMCGVMQRPYERVAGPENRLLTLKIPAPREGYRYQVNWTWSPNRS